MWRNRWFIRINMNREKEPKYRRKLFKRRFWEVINRREKFEERSRNVVESYKKCLSKLLKHTFAIRIFSTLRWDLRTSRFICFKMILIWKSKYETWMIIYCSKTKRVRYDIPSSKSLLTILTWRKNQGKRIRS